jgi:oligopeptide/dipeptide ABC transporter ATP-binding protein
MASAQPILDVQDVTKSYRTGSALRAGRSPVFQAVAGVSLSVLGGETFGLVGESGSGKSTLARLMVGLERATSGQIAFRGKPLPALGARRDQATRRLVQLVFQDPQASLDPRMRVSSIISEPLRIHRIGTREERARTVSRLLAEVGLPADSGSRYPHEFSGGQRQRIGIARALSLDAKLIVADEPVSALDVSIQSQILNLLTRLKELHSLTYVLISHDMSVINHVSDRVGVMYLGKLVEIGPTEAVTQTPAHPYTQALLAAIPAMRPSESRGRTHGIDLEPASPAAPPSGCRYHPRCPIAQDICKRDEPPLTALRGAHLAACHFPLRDAFPLPGRSHADGAAAFGRGAGELPNSS